MPTPTPEQLKKLERLAKVLDNGDIELLKLVDEIETKTGQEIQTIKAIVDKALAVAEIPDNTPKQIINMLDKKGISYIKYNQSKKGDRADKMQKMAKEYGLMFGLGGIMYTTNSS